MTDIKVQCVDCKTEVILPPSDRPGFVKITPLTNWTAPPPRCPDCSLKIAGVI